ncbi:MAG: molybdopterin biosynthesis protein [Candidatus Pelagibacter sp.]|nr:molybdopterin biosynthesis protein [Candidatus Pelagibacter sp.]OUW67353.1 MAG: molybdopterin biosynthesis protein [Candidatus Pelagibacter sp. TMED202]|tara:strand:+ start:13796 stop:14539 length:744 start_codon:yes stop_codon:yes gene_type:complete
MKISGKEYQRFSKQIILKKFGVIGQKKLKSSKVLVLGMGGLGCPLSIYLASLGVGTIGIVDNDKVELSNLNRQIIYNVKDIGKYKVNVAKNKIKLINKKIVIKSYKIRVNKNNIEKLIKNFDIICDGTDNFETRLLVNDHTLKQKKVLISAAVSGFDGHIFKFNFKKRTPCYRCFLPEVPEQSNNCEADGVIPTITGIMGTLQANEVVNSILNFNSNMEKKMIIFNSIKMNFRTINLSRNKNCSNKC